MKISFAFADESMARTVFYDLFVQAVKRAPAFTPNENAADILFPAEDTAMETNWPRYGDQASAFLRGTMDNARYKAYLQRLAASPRPLCIVNMHPFIRIPHILAHQTQVFVADGCLPIWERTLNARAISMPALPIVAPTATTTERAVLASFRGVMSHPCRAALQKLHTGKDIICEIVPRQNHVGQLDATQGKTDAGFTGLMAKSVFAFIPRGDALFSYRLLEAMAAGCIPIVLSDGWVLPFDRTIDWPNVALTVPEAVIPEIPALLKDFPTVRIAAMQRNVRETYARHFASLDLIVKTLLGELDLIRAR